MPKVKSAPPEPSALNCACATARRTARLLTQMYDAHLRASQIEASQFNLLAVLDAVPGSSQAVIVRLLDMEKTTLSRNLKLLRSKGWIAPSPAKDGRERGFVLTPAGKHRYEAAKPAWRSAQDQLQSAMTADEWQTMWKAFGTISRAAHEIGRKPNVQTDEGHRRIPADSGVTRRGAGKP